MIMRTTIILTTLLFSTLLVSGQSKLEIPILDMIS